MNPYHHSTRQVTIRSLSSQWRGLLMMAVLSMLCTIGCEQKSSDDTVAFTGVGSALAQPMHAPRSVAGPSDAFMSEVNAQKGPSFMEGESGESIPSDATGQMDVDRKIIYVADVQVIVKDFEAAEQKLQVLIKQHKALVAQSDLGAAAGQRREGRWKIRIPAAEFDAFIKNISGMGELQRSKLDSQDVTEEFFDVQSRIKNKKIEEERLLKLLQEATGKLTEILQVEKELSRVRGDIERMQGRLNYLSNLTSLTTVMLSIVEMKDYQPPTSPTFTTKIGRSFDRSWEAFVGFWETLALFAVAMVPWSPFLLILIVLGVWLMRKFLKFSRLAWQNRMNRTVETSMAAATESPANP